MAKKNIIGLGVVLLFIIAVRLYYLYDTKRSDRILRRLNEAYPALDYHTKVEARVVSIDHPHPETLRNSSHHAFVVLDDSLKRRISASHDLLTDTLMLDDVLNVGDWIIKKSNSDTFAIYKIKNTDTLKYTFELRDDLGYLLNK